MIIVTIRDTVGRTVFTQPPAVNLVQTYDRNYMSSVRIEGPDEYLRTLRHTELKDPSEPHRVAITANRIVVSIAANCLNVYLFTI